AVSIKPDTAEIHNNLGIALKEQGKLDEALGLFRKALSLKPDFAEAYYNMGNAFRDRGKLEESIEAYNKALSIKPDYALSYNNMGNALRDQGKLEEATEAFKKAIAINADFAEAYSNMGNALQNQGKLKEAIGAYNQAISAKPNYDMAYWKRSGAADTLSEAKNWVERCLKVNPNHLEAKLIMTAFEFYEGNKGEFNDILNSSLKDHPFTRSFIWVFSLNKLPPLFFHRWALFDEMIKLSKTQRPFYEFGVWRGEAFKYFIKTFKKGYGFDTFKGLPENWHDIKTGTYSSEGNVPKIKGGEFIVGKFEDTLPRFFSENRPTASLINFDADLYSSTICALNFAKQVIDRHTILIFDEFIINKNWEEDEYKALEEFCAINQYTYEVLAISFFTKQVAVRIIGI
ncbi:tetratricopeptide repeat protein, partial [Paracoccaceae bacterium]|nr:tetratricopeptide repeat protein [Paracoccaceae bacterium]